MFAENVVNRPIGPTRLLLAAVLAVALPLCCCRGGMLASLLGGGAGECSLSAALDAPYRTAPPSTRADEPAGGCCGEEDKPQPGHDDGPCNCGHQKEIKSLPEAPPSLAGVGQVVDFLPAPVGFVPMAGPVAFAARPTREAVPRPPTTLLRLHCALIV